MSLHAKNSANHCKCCREVVQRRVYTVTGAVPEEAQVEDLIECGESEQVFQQAIRAGGKLQVGRHNKFRHENMSLESETG